MSLYNVHVININISRYNHFVIFITNIFYVQFFIGMFNGLRKMVGKGMDDISSINQQPLIQPTQLNISSNKFTKKRKVIEREHPPTIKKKYVMFHKLRFCFMQIFFLS